MADITTYLSSILSSVYGKDVRQSIVNAIRQCYDDGKAGAIDLDARTELSLIFPQIEGGRLFEVCISIDDWNNAQYNGWYQSSMNAPDGNIWFGLVSRSDIGYITQIVFRQSDDDMSTCVRTKNSTAGWSEWEWVNPPMETNVEYRTTERYCITYPDDTSKTLPVYVQRVSVGAIKSGVQTATPAAPDDVAAVIDCKIHSQYWYAPEASDVSYRYILASGGSGPSDDAESGLSAICMYRKSLSVGDTDWGSPIWAIRIYAGTLFVGNEAYATIKYVRDPNYWAQDLTSLFPYS